MKLKKIKRKDERIKGNLLATICICRCSCSSYKVGGASTGWGANSQALRQPGYIAYYGKGGFEYSGGGSGGGFR